MRQTLRIVLRLGLAVGAIGLAAGPAPAQVGAPPPTLLPFPPQPPPVPLASAKLPVGESVPMFIDYASRTGINERETVRKMIWAARENAAVAVELCRQITAAQRSDHSRALIALSILGELRNRVGEKCLTDFLHQPFPKEGTVVAGEIVEQTSLGVLQGKAVDGLAYSGTPTGEREVMWAVASHPSRIVRAEAINAYLWNHQDSAAAREALGKFVRPEERDFLDRPRHEPGMTAEQFNARLEAYAAKHPAPKPEALPRGKLALESAVGDGPPPRKEPPPASTPPEGRQ